MLLRFCIYSLFLILLSFTQEVTSQQQCPQLIVRRYVEYSCTLQRNRNSRCTFTCSPGYELRSRSARYRVCRCFPTLCIWTGPIATCVPSTSTRSTTTTTVATSSSSTTATTPATVSTADSFTVPSHCPSLSVGQHSFQAVDTWPTGGIFRVSLNTDQMSVDNGWSVIVRFMTNLTSNLTVMSWNSEVMRAEGRDLGLSNMEHNHDLTGYNAFSFTVLILGASMEEMSNYTATVGFYQQKVENTTCFISMDSEIPEEQTTPPTESSTSVATETTATRSTTRSTTRISRRTSTRAPRTTRSTTTTTTQPPTTTTTTTRATRPRTQPPSNLDIHSARINDAAVRRYRGRCNVLRNSLRVENPSYPAPGGRSNAFRFNGHVVISGQSNRINDWTLKVVFSKRVVNVQLWEARFDRKSNDGRVYIFRPLSWNANLRNDFAFQIIPEMRTRSIPQAVMYLCPNGVTPDLRHDGIFERVRVTTTTTRRPTSRPSRVTRPTTTRSTTRPTRRPTTSRTTTTRPPNDARCRSPAGRVPRRPGQTQVRYNRSPRNERRPYDYNQVIALSNLFYEAQRSGDLPSNNRIPWKGDSGLRDGCDVGRDLTGGWYDAGDHVKFGFPMAWSVTTLAWGVIEFRNAYADAGELSNILSSLKWATDYFIKAHPSKYEFYGQVGNAQADHGYWGRPEEMQMSRPSYKITRSRPGTEIAAETAAALAATSVVFRDVNRRYANLLVRHARDLYDFADRYRDNYHKSIPGAAPYYRSYSGYQDELVWGALWLYRATNQRSYLNDAIRKYRQYGGGSTPRLFSWDDKRAGSQVLMANFTRQSQYRNHVAAYQRFLASAPRTPRGLTWLDKWGSNRYAANGAFIALAASKVTGFNRRDQQSYIRYARSQIHYMLGGSGRSYVVGYGNNPPTQPHHRSSSCPASPAACHWGNAFHSNRNNPNILYGALIAGPARNGSFVNDRTDYVTNEVAVDYNAGFQGAVAGLKYYQIQARRS